MTGRWFRLASRAARTGQIDYSSWTGSVRDFQRERLLLDDLELDMVANVFSMYVNTLSSSRIPLVGIIEDMTMPWRSEAVTRKSVMDEMDEFLEGESNNG